MNVIFTSQAKEDLVFWKKHDIKIVKKIEQLISAIQTSPYAGIGKPELLRHDKLGYWSRRINHEHRLVYKVHDKTLYVVQCRYHY